MRCNIFKKVRGYIKSARLESIIVTISFLLLGLYCATKELSLGLSLVGLLSVSLIVTAGSWQNYVFDIEVDKKSGKNIDFFKFISPREMFIVSIMAGIIGVCILYLIDFYAFLLGILEFLIFLIYAMPPFRFKSKIFFDFLSNMLVFGTIPFLIGFRIANAPIYLDSMLLGLILGLLAGSYYLFISGFEIDADRKANVRNTCVKLGFKNNSYLAFFVFFASMSSFILLFNFSNIVIVVGFFVSCPFVLLTLFTKKIQKVIVLVSFMFIFWNGSVLLLLSIFTKSILSIAFFVILLTIFIMAVYTWMVTEI